MEKQEEDRFTFTWIIENYTGLHIRYESSMFTLNCLPDIEWTLKISLKRNSVILLDLCGSDYVLTSYKICSNCELLTYEENFIVSLDRRIYELKNTQQVSLGSFQKDLVSRCIVKNILIIKCFFSLIKETNDQEMFPPLPYKNGLFSDVVLRTSDVSFNVHKAMLWARWPKLAEKLDAENSSELVLDVASNVLEAIIRYVYTGKMDFSDYEFSAEVSAAAIKYALPHVICTPTVAVTCRTQPSESEMYFAWPIKNFSSLPINTRLKSPVFTVNNLESYKYYLIFRIQEGAFHRRIFDIALCSVNFSPQFITVRGNISLDGINSLVKAPLTGMPPFWLATFTQSISTNPEDILLLKCELKFLKLQNSKIVKSFNAFAPSVSCRYFKRDLENLYESGKSSDVDIIAGSDIIRAHKFILCARSSVFSRMFETEMIESQNNCVKISDMDSLTIKSMLLFLYTGKLSSVTYNGAKELYTVADKYDIPALKRRCSFELKCSLRVQNVCELLQFPDLYSDDYLYDCVFEFISENAEEVFATEEWKKICKNNMCAKLLMKSIIRNNPAIRVT